MPMRAPIALDKRNHRLVPSVELVGFLLMTCFVLLFFWFR